MPTSSIEADNDYVTITDAVIQRGYKNCITTSRKFFSSAAFMTANLPSEKRKAIAAVAWHLLRCADFLTLESFDGLSLDIWKENLNDLSDTFSGKCRTAEDAALADAVKRFQIPKEHLFEMMTAADAWIRNRKFETHEQLDLFAAKFGGSMMAAAVPILSDRSMEDFKPTIHCGQAIHLTHMLANLIPNLKQHQSFYATDDVERSGLSITRTMMRQSSPELKQFVRLQTSRIEKHFIVGGQLVNHLDFGGKRTLSSLLDYHWALFTKMRANPDSILQVGGVLNQRERLQLRTRHMMGTEGKSPIIGVSEHH
ncbi:squalene/phytoene synthase family protein [bacterium]|nr:squalene/phytoene synthase family protein [bacterium]